MRSAKNAEQANIRRMLAEHSGTDPEDWYLVFRARYGLEVIFRALQQQRGSGTVLTQLFTCATAVNPILTAGLTPVYGDISADTVALDPGRLPEVHDLRAVVLQNTFGIISGETASALRAFADSSEALLVEDSAHCAGRMARTDGGHPLADVSVHSFGAEKILPTAYGGAVWVNPDLDSSISGALRSLFEGLAEPGGRLRFAASTYRIQLGVLNRLPAAISTPARRALTRTGLFDPPIAQAETVGRQGESQPLGANKWVARQVEDALAGLTAVEAQRAEATSVYLQQLAGRVEVPAGITPGTPLVRFPFLVPAGLDAEAVFTELSREGIYVGRWYRPSLFPGVADPSLYHWDPDATGLPVTKDITARVLNLPTGGGAAEAERVAQVTLRTVV